MLSFSWTLHPGDLLDWLAGDGGGRGWWQDVSLRLETLHDEARLPADLLTPEHGAAVLVDGEVAPGAPHRGGGEKAGSGTGGGHKPRGPRERGRGPGLGLPAADGELLGPLQGPLGFRAHDLIVD